MSKGLLALKLLRSRKRLLHAFCSLRVFIRASFLPLLLALHLPHELPQHSNVLMLVQLKVEAVPLGKSDLEQVVVEGILREANLLSGVLKTVSDQIPGQIVSYPIKEAAPSLHLVNDEVDAPLLGALVVLFIAQPLAEGLRGDARIRAHADNLLLFF
jgi:hypothetical protein